MKNDVLRQAVAYAKKHRRKERWEMIVTCLAAFVVFCTTYALILPAITMEKQPQCGLEEHVHTMKCYAPADEDYIATPSNLLKDENGHKHKDSCFTMERGVLICGEEEAEPHVHSKENGCYTLVLNEDATPSDASYELTWKLDCDQHEGEGHKHTDACYEWERYLTCPYADVDAEEDEDEEDEYGEFVDRWVLTCGKEEHKHTEKCYEDPATPSDATPSDAVATPSGWIDPDDLVAYAQVTDEYSDPILLVMFVEELADDYGAMAMARNGDGIDLGQFLQNVQVQYKEGENWKDLPEGTPVKKGDYIGFRLEYKINGGSLSPGNNKVVYKLPDGVTAVKEESGRVYNDSGAEVGSYYISTDGLITIVFDEKYTKQNQAGELIDGFIRFESQVNSNSDSDETIKIAFTDKLVVEVPVINTDEDKADLKVVKEATEVDENAGTVKYTITVSSKNGTGTEVKLTDVMENIGLINGTVSVSGPNNSSQTSVEVTDKGFNMTLPQMNAGDVYTITYSAKIPENHTADINAKNNVKVTSTKKDTTRPLEDQAHVDTKFEQTYVQKSGEKIDGGKIRWTIIINSSKNDLNGWTLKDIFNDGEYKGAVTMVGSDGVSHSINLPYRFDGKDNIKTNDRYTITYETDADSALGSWDAKNKAELTPPDGSGGISSEDHVNTGVENRPLSKNADTLTVNPGVDGTQKTATIQWTITVDSSKGEIPAGWTCSDTPENGQWFTEEQIQTLKSNLEASMKEAGLDEKAYTIELTKDSNSGRYTAYKITFKNVLPKGTKFSFSYTTTAPLAGGPQDFKNNANINNKVWSNDSIHYKPGEFTVEKFDLNGWKAEDTEHKYDAQELDKNGVLKWGIKISVPDNYAGGELVVTETLPEEVDLQKLKISFKEGINGRDDISNSGSYDVYDWKWTGGKNHKIKTENEGQIIKIHIPEELVQCSYLNEIDFEVYAKIKETYQWEEAATGRVEGSFTNGVKITSQDKKVDMGDEHTQTVIKEDVKKILDKTSSGIKDNIVPYSITVNPNGDDLLKDGDVLTLTDTMTAYNGHVMVNLVPESLKVYRLTESGEKGEMLGSSEVPYTFEATPKDEQNTIYTLKMKIPDGTPLLIEYKYKMSSETVGANKCDLENHAKLEGITETSGESSTKVTISITSSSAGANIKGITICKVEAGNYGVVLKNAHFKLYKYDGTKKEYVLVDEEYTTNSDGQVSIGEMSLNTAYYLVESVAPDGYIKETKPFYFWIKSADITANPITKPDDFNPDKECTVGDVVYFENEKQELVVEKKWYNQDGDDITQTRSGPITFKLYRKESTTPPGEEEWDGRTEISCLVNYHNEITHIPIKDNSEETMSIISYQGSKITIRAEAGDSSIPDNTVPLKIYSVDEGNRETLETTTLLREANSMVFSRTFELNYENCTKMEIEIDTSNIWQFHNNSQKFSWSVEQASPPDKKPDECKEYSISLQDGWKKVFTDLPVMDQSGDKTVYYTYYVAEVNVPNCITEYTNNGGIPTGTIIIRNTVTEVPSYELPETGGPGTRRYITGGLLMLASAVILLLYRFKKRGKEGYAPF